mmetsp:Transcript_39980/g.72044  ORF Transcript_39980/g.72044 Transcript_39980/m.72044 type:complete len:438 (+) Transcript_39980:3704-5017(+)
MLSQFYQIAKIMDAFNRGRIFARSILLARKAVLAIEVREAKPILEEEPCIPACHDLIGCIQRRLLRRALRTTAPLGAAGTATRGELARTRTLRILMDKLKLLAGILHLRRLLDSEVCLTLADGRRIGFTPCSLGDASFGAEFATFRAVFTEATLLGSLTFWTAGSGFSLDRLLCFGNVDWLLCLGNSDRLLHLGIIDLLLRFGLCLTLLRFLLRLFLHYLHDRLHLRLSPLPLLDSIRHLRILRRIRTKRNGVGLPSKINPRIPLHIFIIGEIIRPLFLLLQNLRLLHSCTGGMEVKPRNQATTVNVGPSLGFHLVPHVGPCHVTDFALGGGGAVALSDILRTGRPSRFRLVVLGEASRAVGGAHRRCAAGSSLAPRRWLFGGAHRLAGSLVARKFDSLHGKCRLVHSARHGLVLHLYRGPSHRDPPRRCTFQRCWL